MNQIKIIHTADWHADADPVKKEKLENSLNQLYEFCKTNDVDVLLIAGDVWEKQQYYSANSGVHLVTRYLRLISKWVKFIFITKGNNEHDRAGSISLLHQLEPNIYAYEYPVVLGVSLNGIRDNRITEPALDLLRAEPACYDIDLIVSMIPYPTNQMFIEADSIDNNNVEFVKQFEQIFELMADTTEAYTCPKVLALHANVVGSRLSTGQTLVSQDIMVAPSTIEKANHDYYAFGHIHIRQFFKWYMGYSGSIYNKSWGETEQKSFELIVFNGKTGKDLLQPKQVLLTAAKPMIKIEAEFFDGKVISDSVFENQLEDAEVLDAEYRIRILVHENDRKSLTKETVENLQAKFNDAKMEIITIPDKRESRSEEIMNCHSLLDEVIEYGKITNQFVEPNPDNETQMILTAPVSEKVFKVQDGREAI